MFGSKRSVQELKKMHESLRDSFGHVRGDMQALADWVQYLHQRDQHILATIHHHQKHTHHQLRQVHGKIPDVAELHSKMGHHHRRLNDVEAEMTKVHKVERQLKEVQQEIEDLPKIKADLKQLVDYYYKYEEALKKVEDLDSEIVSIHGKLEKIEAQPKHAPNHQMQEQPVTKELGEITELRSRLAQLESTSRQTPMRDKLIKKVTKKSKDYVKNLVLSYIRKYERVSGLRLREMVVEEQGLASKSSFYRILEEIELLEEVEVIRQGKEKHFFYKLLKHA